MKKEEKKEPRYCHNCHYPLSPLGVFCSNCGQKYTTGKVTIGHLLHDLIEAVFNIDSKIFRTIGALFIPGKLTTEYFKGRHKRYLNPLRLFFITAVIQIATISFFIDKPMSRMLHQFESTLTRDAHEAVFIDSFEVARKRVLEQFDHPPLVEEAFDSLALQFDHNSNNDSLSYGYIKLHELNLEEDPIVEVKIAVWDLLEMESDELLEAYEIDDFWGKLTIGQAVKINKEGVSFIRFLIGQIIWMVLAMMVALAFILKLLYIRRKRYYVEHLIFSFHYHTFAFLLCSIGLIIDFGILNREISIFATSSFGITLVYLFVAMRRVYQQGFFKTFFKYCFLNFSYLFIFTLFLSLTFFLSAALY